MNRRPYQQIVLDEFIGAENRFWALLWERQAGKSTTLADFALYEMLRHENRTVIYASASLLLSQEITIKAAIRTNQGIREMIESDAALLKEFADSAQAIIEMPATHVRHPFPDVAAVLRKILRLRNRNVFSHGLAHSAKAFWPEKGDLRGFLPTVAGQGAEAPVEFKTFDASTGKEIIGGNGANAKRISAASFAELFSQQRLEFRVYHDRTSYSRTKVIAPNIATAR